VLAGLEVNPGSRKTLRMRGLVFDRTTVIAAASAVAAHGAFCYWIQVTSSAGGWQWFPAFVVDFPASIFVLSFQGALLPLICSALSAVLFGRSLRSGLFAKCVVFLVGGPDDRFPRRVGPSFCDGGLRSGSGLPGDDPFRRQ